LGFRVLGLGAYGLRGLSGDEREGGAGAARQSPEDVGFRVWSLTFSEYGV